MGRHYAIGQHPGIKIITRISTKQSFVIPSSIQHIPKYSINLRLFKSLGYCFYYMPIFKNIVRIQITDNISRSHPQSFVHGFVNTGICFTDIFQSSFKQRNILFYCRNGIIYGTSVNSNALYVRISLSQNRSKVSTQFRAYPFVRALFSALNRVLLIN